MCRLMQHVGLLLLVLCDCFQNLTASTLCRTPSIQPTGENNFVKKLYLCCFDTSQQRCKYCFPTYNTGSSTFSKFPTSLPFGRHSLLHGLLEESFFPCGNILCQSVVFLWQYPLPSGRQIAEISKKRRCGYQVQYGVVISCYWCLYCLDDNRSIPSVSCYTCSCKTQYYERRVAR